MFRKMFGRYYSVTLTILRFVTGLLFWQHGVAKLFGWFGGQVVPVGSLFWVAGVIESVGGILIFLGLFTRPVAFVLAGEMATAYFIGHFPNGFWPIVTRGVPAVLFCFIYLLLATAGPGRCHLDGLLSRKPADTFAALFDRFYPVSLTLLRIVTGLMFWQYGASKLFGMFGGRQMIFSVNPQVFIAGILEFCGGPMIALGLFTRPLAFLLSGEMAIAFWTSHVPRGPSLWPIQNQGEPAALFCFIFLFLATAGPGKASLDSILMKESSEP